jgi:hypothetical protein
MSVHAPAAGGRGGSGGLPAGRRESRTAVEEGVEEGVEVSVEAVEAVFEEGVEVSVEAVEAVFERSVVAVFDQSVEQCRVESTAGEAPARQRSLDELHGLGADRRRDAGVAIERADLTARSKTAPQLFEVIDLLDRGVEQPIRVVSLDDDMDASAHRCEPSLDSLMRSHVVRVPSSGGGHVNCLPTG